MYYEQYNFIMKCQGSKSTNDDSRLEMHCAAAMIVPPVKSLPYIACRGPAVNKRNFAVKDRSVLSETN